MTTTLRRGLLAGAVGTTVLNLVTYLDMALRGRPASSAPADLVSASAARAGVAVPGDRGQRAARRESLGALAGIGTGLGVGVLASVTRSGVRLPGPLAAVATGATAMAASDVPLAVLGVSDPRTWTATDWFTDGVAHLAYGTATHATLVALETPATPATRAPAGLVSRSALLGLATGARSSLGTSAPLLAAHGVSGRGAAAALGVAGELVADKLPATRSRLEGPGVGVRLASGATGGALLARGAGVAPVVPVAAGVVGSLAGTYAGAAWRRWASRRRPDWQCALVEDGVALLLAVVAVRPHRGAGHT